MEQLVNTVVAAMDNPERIKGLIVDGAAHLGSGYVLAKGFFPEGGKVKTAIRSLVGLLPDADFILPGLVHRSPTHGWAAPLLPLGYSLFESSREKAIAMSSLGVASHLFIDYQLPTFEQKAVYVGLLGAGLIIQKGNDLRKKL